MAKILFEYGTAAHLAILTVAPLFLVAIGEASAHATVLLWMSLFGLLWILMNPAQRSGEWPRDARHRIGWELVRNPFLSFCVVALVLSVVQAVNVGIAPVYDVSSRLWRLNGPAISLLPGSVRGHGLVPLAGLVGVGVVTLGVRHALGSRSRYAYLLMSAILAALAVVFWRMLPSRGIAVPHLEIAADDPSYLGTLLGVYFLFAIVAWVESWRQKAVVLELVSAAAAMVLLAGLLFHAPTLSLLVFGSLAVLITACGIVLTVSRRRGSAWFRSIVAFAIIVMPVALLVFHEISRPAIWPVFPDGFFAARGAASSAALEGWRTSPQLGLGLGAYPLSFGFFAKPEDWKFLSSFLVAPANGWVLFLFERGFLGFALLLAAVGLLLRDGIRRYVNAGSAWSLSVMHLLGPAVLLAVIGLMFFECTFVQVEWLVAVGASLSLTAAAFPDRGSDHG